MDVENRRETAPQFSQTFALPLVVLLALTAATRLRPEAYPGRGWLFWKRGLVAAILAHFAVDTVLHVLPALLN